MKTTQSSMDFTFKIGAPAGLGVMTTGTAFAKIAQRSGWHIFGYAEYPSLIKGGHNVFEIHFSDEEVYAPKKEVDLLVALDKLTLDLHIGEIKEMGGIIMDAENLEIDPKNYPQIEDKKLKFLKIPTSKILEENKAPKLMENNIALGAACAYFGFDLKILMDLIEATFARKGKEVIDYNQKVAKAGYNYLKENYSDKVLGVLGKLGKSGEEKVVMTGNEAASVGTISAGCQLYAAYPMTPTSQILTILADKGPKYGMVVKHAEDEIAVINIVIGAQFAGVRAACGTSGGGFALMNETVSLAGITEIGIVVFMGMRPGPATGMPTFTDQGDLKFVISSGHGEFPKIVLAPGDMEEVFQVTLEAFDLADIYQTPVIVLTDKYVNESIKTVPISNFQFLISKIDRGKLITKDDMGDKDDKGKFLRYALTEDGISPRPIPGIPNHVFQANSYEHTLDGHTSEEIKDRTEQVAKRNRKAQTFLKNHVKGPKLYGPEKAEITLVTWGSLKLSALEALRLLNKGNQGNMGDKGRVNVLHFTYLWPFPKNLVMPYLDKIKRPVLLENNSLGQFGDLLCQETGYAIKDKLLKYDGRPIFAEEIISYLSNLENL